LLSKKLKQGGRKMKTRALIIIVFLLLFGMYAVLGNTDDYDWPVEGA
jgi:hypothetical protein